MGNRKISIRLWTGLRIIPVIFIFINYHFSVQPRRSPVSVLILFIVMIMIITVLLLLRRNREVVDESAKKALDRADAFSYRIFFMYSVAVVLVGSTFINNMKLMGYLVAGGMVIVTVIRTIIFCVLDSRGMM
ncbi:MAG: hypothetical protein FWD71_22275 [Oscillospiraceae bacterium]|nr:hypothetical protein [Oscillospiraceae bacterium]